MGHAVPLTAFQALYDVEATVGDAEPARRLEERQLRSKPVYDELVEWCKKYKPFEPPGSLLGKGIQYLLNHRVALMRFLDDGVVPIDNGIVERLHRKPAQPVSYCTSCSNARNSESPRVARNSRRAPSPTATPGQSVADVGPIEVFGHDLPGGVEDQLSRRKDPFMDELPDCMARNTQLLRRFEHRQATTILHC